MVFLEIKHRTSLQIVQKKKNYSNVQVRLHMQLSNLKTNSKYIMVFFVVASES